MMQQKALGSQGLKVSTIGLGCMGMTYAYRSPDRQQSIDTIHQALESGINLLDSADIYGPETNEKLLAKALKGRRNEVKIATKFGIAYRQENRAVDGRPEYVRESCEGSLKRLDIETIDLYYLHRVDPDVPIEETVGAMGQLVDEGKVRYIGISEAASETIKRAHKTHPLTAVQTEYSLWTRDIEESILPVCRELGIGSVAYSPLGRGFLSGSITSPADIDENDWRSGQERFSGENFERNLTLVDVVKEIADAKNVTPSQLALAWVLQQGDDIVPIPGTTNPKHLEENVKAAEIELSREELNRLEEAFPLNAAAGNRYNSGGMTLVQK
jgi:aryl-alcohol dehydrogenase-like predicted oxidoreductase